MSHILIVLKGWDIPAEILEFIALEYAIIMTKIEILCTVEGELVPQDWKTKFRMSLTVKILHGSGTMQMIHIYSDILRNKMYKRRRHYSTMWQMSELVNHIYLPKIK